jgi:prepilin-type N-terminal cleavage/methylation domain-containing protein/prepilin-type processing-associated H-X9-DG protein
MQNPIDMSSNPARRRPRWPLLRAGFTLIELLTVIAIIGILAAVIVPTVGKVRRTAKNAQCASNLRQWAHAINLYANDNKGNYIIRGTAEDGTTGQTWVAVSNSIPRMLYGRYFPGSTVIGELRNCPLRTDGGFGPSYFLNRPYLQGTTVAPLDKVPLARVRAPSQFMLMVDIDLTAPPSNGYALIGPGGLATYVTPVLTTPDKDRHSGGVNMSFGDGHVRRVTQAEILAHGDRWTRIDN